MYELQGGNSENKFLKMLECHSSFDSPDAFIWRPKPECIRQDIARISPGYRHKRSTFIAERCDLATINQASMVRGGRRPAVAVVVLAPSAASLALGQTVHRPVDTLHATDRDSPVHRLDHHRHHVHLGSSVLDLNSHPLREVVVGKGFDLGSPNQTKGEEGTD